MKVWNKTEEKAPARWDPARFYTIGGRKLPSVTTILSVIDKSGPLMGWAVKQERIAFQNAMLTVLTGPHADEPEKIWNAVEAVAAGMKASDREKDRAADIGKAAHAYIEWLTRKMLGEDPGKEPIIPDAAQWAVESWKDWVKEVDFKPIYSERPVYDMRFGYAGTLDFYGWVRGVLTVGDYKSGKAIYPEAFLQNIAYRHAADSLGMKADQGIILRLPKTVDDPSFESQFVPETSIDDFLAVKRVWEWKRRMEGKPIGG